MFNLFIWEIPHIHLFGREVGWEVSVLLWWLLLCDARDRIQSPYISCPVHELHSWLLLTHWKPKSLVMDSPWHVAAVDSCCKEWVFAASKPCTYRGPSTVGQPGESQEDSCLLTWGFWEPMIPWFRFLGLHWLLLLSCGAPGSLPLASPVTLLVKWGRWLLPYRGVITSKWAHWPNVHITTPGTL